MANEAYRAVFLRVHPTGKMVLSLTTSPTGRRRSTHSSSPTSSAFLRSTSRSFPRTPIGSGSATATTRARQTGRRPRSSAPTEKIRGKGQLLAGMALDAPPETLKWFNGAWLKAEGSDPTQVKTVEDIALYAHGTGALPPGVEGGLDAQTVYAD